VLAAIMRFSCVAFVCILDYGVVLASKLCIKEILPGSIAASDGSLKEGDTIVMVCSNRSVHLQSFTVVTVHLM